MPSTVLFQLRKGKTYLVPQNLKEPLGVGRISPFHAGAGTNEYQLSLPFPNGHEKRTSWDIIISPRSAARQAKSSSNEFGPHGSSEVRPHSDISVGSTAGARDGGPAEAGRSSAVKRQKRLREKTLLSHRRSMGRDVA